jgi:hypothetical protein
MTSVFTDLLNRQTEILSIKVSLTRSSVWRLTNDLFYGCRLHKPYHLYVGFHCSINISQRVKEPDHGGSCAVPFAGQYSYLNSLLQWYFSQSVVNQRPEAAATTSFSLFSLKQSVKIDLLSLIHVNSSLQIYPDKAVLQSSIYTICRHFHWHHRG